MDSRKLLKILVDNIFYRRFGQKKLFYKEEIDQFKTIVHLDKVENNGGFLGGFASDPESIDFSRNNAEGDYYFVDVYNTDSEVEYINDFLEKFRMISLQRFLSNILPLFYIFLA